MWDTIKIRIRRGNIHKNAYSNFSPEFERRKFEDLSESEKRIQNGVIREYKLRTNLLGNEYMPKVVLYEKFTKNRDNIYRDILLEFSIPKIFFENNLEEISEKEYLSIRSLLLGKLKRVGIITNGEYIDAAVVTKIHAGKNILLPNQYSMKGIIDELKNTEMGKSFDITERSIAEKDSNKIKPTLTYENRLKNKDEVLTHYSGSKEYVFYDKVRDILNSKSMALDKHKTNYERELINTYNLRKKEIFRYEYRIKNTSSLKAEFNKAMGRPNNRNNIIKFKEVFDDKLFEKILINSWNKIIDKPENQLALKFDEENMDNVVRMLFSECSKKSKGVHSQNLAFSSFGLSMLASKFSMKFIKKECERFWSKRACGDRLRQKVKTASKLLKDLNYPDNIIFINKEINKNEKITKEKLEDMI